MIPPGFSFPKRIRLLSGSDFSPVFDSPPFKASDRYFLILAIPNNLGHARLGLVVAKKNVRFAVDRNRFKRLVRESFRPKQHQLPAIDAIVLARRGVDTLPNSQLTNTLNKLWTRIAKQVEKRKQEKQD